MERTLLLNFRGKICTFKKSYRNDKEGFIMQYGMQEVSCYRMSLVKGCLEEEREAAKMRDQGSLRAPGSVGWLLRRQNQLWKGL